MKSLVYTILLFTIYCALIGRSNDSFKKCTNVQEAKQIVDNYISIWDNKYQNLCKQSRNDVLKFKFQKLHDDLTTISGCGQLCINLSFKQQMEVSEYAYIEFNKHIQLKKLLETSEIDCW